MPHELPVNWTEIEKACITGVPQRQVAKDVAAKTEGVESDSLYKAIRKRASRERWPIPASIMRRARAQAMVATGAATDAKQGAAWKPGESGRKQAGLMLGALGIEHQERRAAELLSVADGAESGESSPNGAIGEGIAVGDAGLSGIGGGEALSKAAPSATELVTQSLATRGRAGLSLALDAALASLQSLQASETTVPIRSMQDLFTAVKATQAAAGLDKPATAVSIVLDRGPNASITAWECVEST